MYCPQCGQEQATNEMRFCSRCGFLLTRVSEVLSQGGVVAESDQSSQELLASPRRLGVKQGVLMMLFGVVIVPVLAILSDHTDLRLLDLLVPLSAVICFAGGMMRILYAMIFEQGAPASRNELPAYVPTTVPAQLNSRPRVSALPPAQKMPVSNFQSRRSNTAELVQPASITENTTRLLDEEKATRNE
ncbi:MAG: hypothetical protein QOJ64_250 [Acidobacteriota bacterium]|nr:hypothetical protein [Acidobacteriota bacterium]